MDFKRAYKRLKKDVWAIASLIYILLICFTSVFAYQIVPDKTENANQMHLSIHSKPPGFSCKVLTIPGPLGTEKKFSLRGQINSSDEIPIQEIIWKEDAVFFKRYGNATNYFEEVSFNLFPKELSKKEIENIYLTLGNQKKLLILIIYKVKIMFSSTQLLTFPEHELVQLQFL